MNDDDECAVCYKEQRRTAAKQHTCCECGHPIQVGQKYMYCQGISDHRPFIFKQHLLCYGLCREMNRHIYRTCRVSFGCMREGVRHLPQRHYERCKLLLHNIDVAYAPLASSAALS